MSKLETALPNLPKLLKIDSRMVRNQMKERDVHLEIIKKVLTKPQDQRNFHDLKTLIPLMQNISFFKERKIKLREISDICLGLEYL